MTVSDLNRAIQNIDDVYLEIAEAPEKEIIKLIDRKKIIVIALAACLALCAAVTAYAHAGELKSIIFGWGNNMDIKTFTDENNVEVSEVTVYTESLIDPVVIENGRMIFIVNEENVDITAEVSEEKAFKYEYTDAEGITHLWLVGLLDANLQHYGYAEYLKNENGEWIGGYDARINTEADGHTNAKWLETAKNENVIPG